MNRAIIITVAVLLTVLIVVTQSVRRQRNVLFDSLTVFNALFLVLFVFIPIWLNVVDLRSFEQTGWRWIFKRHFDDEAFVTASVITIAAYLAILLGVRLGDITVNTLARIRTLPGGVVNDRTVPGEIFVSGILLLFIGGTALAVYTWSIGGLRPLVLDALLFRGDAPPVISRWAFLKNVGFASLGASYCFYAIKRAPHSRALSVASTILFVVSFAVAILQLFHAAGRLSLVAYLITFPLAAMAIRREWGWRTMLASVGLILAVVISGKQLFFPRVGADAVSSGWRAVGQDISQASKDFAIEFSFPYITLANATVDVPEVSPYRFFADIPLAVVYLVPQRVFGVTHPPMVSMINTDLMSDGGSGTIPVDLVSFGYFSAGIAGVLVVTLVFGFVLALSELLFSGERGAVFRAAVTLFLVFRVMYGDPTLVLQAGFYLLMTVAVLILVRVLRQGLAGAGIQSVQVAHQQAQAD